MKNYFLLAIGLLFSMYCYSQKDQQRDNDLKDLRGFAHYVSIENKKLCLNIKSNKDSFGLIYISDLTGKNILSDTLIIKNNYSKKLIDQWLSKSGFHSISKNEKGSLVKTLNKYFYKREL